MNFADHGTQGLLALAQKRHALGRCCGFGGGRSLLPRFGSGGGQGLRRTVVPGDRGRHEAFLDLGRTTDGAFDEAARTLFLKGIARGKPALEIMRLITDEGVADHDTALIPSDCLT